MGELPRTHAPNGQTAQVCRGSSSWVPRVCGYPPPQPGLSRLSQNLPFHPATPPTPSCWFGCCCCILLKDPHCEGNWNTGFFQGFPPPSPGASRQLASFQLPGKSSPLYPPPPQPVPAASVSALGRCLSPWHAVSLQEGLVRVQTPGAGTLPAASFLGSDPGSLALNSGEAGNPALGSNAKCTEVCLRLHQGHPW